MEDIVIATFDETNAALQGLRELQQLDDAAELKLRAAAVVERRPDGTWRIADETEEPAFGATVAGGPGPRSKPSSKAPPRPPRRATGRPGGSFSATRPRPARADANP